MTLDPKLKADWVAALRSGEYAQVTNRLADRGFDSFCCLGVLCEVDPQVRRADDGDSEYSFPLLPEAGGDPDDRDYMEAELPGGYMHMIGMPGEVHSRLIRMNDEDGASFDEIADFVEENL